MKKLFLLALTLVLICSAVYADPLPLLADDSVNFLLNLSEATVSALAGITTTAPDMAAIKMGYTNKEASDIKLAIPTDSLETGTTFYVWYYVNGMANQCDITFIPSPFVGTRKDSSKAFLGYELTVVDTPTVDDNYYGTVPTFNAHTLSSTETYTPPTGAQYIFQTNNAGVSRGFITYNLAVDYTSAEPLDYVASVTIQINAK